MISWPACRGLNWVMRGARAAGPALQRRLRDPVRGGDGGFSVVELVVVVPVFLVLLLVVVAAGRVQDTGVRITGAARDGARAASLQRTPEAADAAARQVVLDNLAGQSVECAGGPVTTVSTGGLVPGGRVDVIVACIAELGDVAFRGLPGSARLSKQASSPVEQYREMGLGFANSEGSAGSNWSLAGGHALSVWGGFANWGLR